GGVIAERPRRNSGFGAARMKSSVLAPSDRRFVDEIVDEVASEPLACALAVAPSLSRQTGLSFKPSLTSISTQSPEPIGTVDLLTITRRRSQSSARPIDWATALT